MNNVYTVTLQYADGSTKSHDFDSLTRADSFAWEIADCMKHGTLVVTSVELLCGTELYFQWTA